MKAEALTFAIFMALVFGVSWWRKVRQSRLKVFLKIGNVLIPLRHRSRVMIAKLDTDAPFTIGLVFKNAKGDAVPAPAGVAVTWTIDVPTVLTGTPSPDTLTDACTITGPGTANVAVSATWPAGASVRAGTATGSVPVQVNVDQTPVSVEPVAV